MTTLNTSVPIVKADGTPTLYFYTQFSALQTLVTPQRLLLTDQASGALTEVYIENGQLLHRLAGGDFPLSTDDIAQAERVVFSTYGDTVSVAAKAKNLTKFGINSVVGTAFETVAQFQGTVANETFVSTNAIDSIVSTSASDTQTISYEGHTIDGSGNLTFFVDEVTLTGQTPVTLPTACARLNRMSIAPSGTFNSPQALPVGQISAYDSSATTVTAGAVNTALAVKALIAAGAAQTEKCASAISQNDYYFISSIEAAIGASGGNAARVEVIGEIRDVFNGGVWKPLGREISLNIDQNGVQVQFRPFLIVPKNHDFRVRARTNANTAQVFCEVDGYLAGIQS